VRKRTLEAFENQDYPFDELVKKVVANREISRNPLFDTAFNFQQEGPYPVELPGLKIVPVEYEYKTASYDLVLNCTETPADLLCMFQYAGQLFEKATIEIMGKYFINIIDAVITEPGIKILDIEIIGIEEKSEIIKTLRNAKGNLINEEIEINRDPTAADEVDFDF
jgi:non-ribosomal peptide synthetase component F